MARCELYQRGLRAAEDISVKLPETEAVGRKRGLTPRWSGRVEDKVPSPEVGVRAAQLNR